MNESAREPFKSRFLFPITLCVSWMDFKALLDFKVTFWGLISPAQVPRVKVPAVGHEPLALQEEALYL